MKFLNTVLAALLAGTSLAAAAHGDRNDAASAGSVRKEQKAWGIAGEPRAVKRTVHITMSDAMRFDPGTIQVKRGEVIRFVVKNDGRLFHEMVIGTKKELDEHAALMARFPDMEHDEPYMTHVKPGATGEIVWHFNRAGAFDFACLMPGHYQAGMLGKINVTGAAAN